MTPGLRKVASTALILAAGGFAFVRLKGPQGLPALWEKYRTIRQLEEENERLKQEIGERQRRNKELSKPEVLEFEIRKRLHKLRKGETDFKLPETEPEKP